MAEAKKEVKKEPKKEVKKAPITEITWEKPSGKKVRTNTEDATIEHAVELGWKRIAEE